MIEFDVQMPDFAELSERAVSRAHKFGATVAAEWFRDERLDLRFTDVSLQRELKYADRIEKYQERKGRIKKRRAYHNYSGASRAQAKRGVKIRATKKFMGVRLTGMPIQYSRKKPGSKRSYRIDLISEITRMSKTEQRRFAEIYRDNFVKQLQAEIDKQSRRSRRG